MSRLERYLELIAALVGSLILVAAAVLVLHLGNNYNKEVTVYSVCGDVVTFEDRAGNLWEYEGKGFRVGDEVILKMNVNGTETYFEDDVIKGVKAH